MLNLLLDEHISPLVATGLRRLDRQLIVRSLAEWENGSFLGRADLACLTEAAHQNLTLVTYDCRTIPPLLKIWGEEGRRHAGVILVDEKTIYLGNIGGLVQALHNVVREKHDWDWINRVHFLQR
jgi:hypothetical protein